MRAHSAVHQVTVADQLKKILGTDVRARPPYATRARKPISEVSAASTFRLVSGRASRVLGCKKNLGTGARKGPRLVS
jgi:hypothetical protein